MSAPRVYPPRVLDASALITLFDGNLDVLNMLTDAESGDVFLLMPALAIAEAELVLRAGARLWEPFLLFRGVRSLELTEHTAIESANLAAENPSPVSPLMIAQAVYEAQNVNGVVVTQTPAAYQGYDVALLPV